MRSLLFASASLIGLSCSVKSFAACGVTQTLRVEGKKPGLYPAGGRNVCEAYLSPKQSFDKFDVVFWGKIVQEKEIGVCPGEKKSDCIVKNFTFKVRKPFKRMDAKSIDILITFAVNPQRTRKSLAKGVFLATCGLMKPTISHSWMIFAKKNVKGELESSTFYCNPSYRTEFPPNLDMMEKDYLTRKRKK